jgi:hypothetical protein
MLAQQARSVAAYSPTGFRGPGSLNIRYKRKVRAVHQLSRPVDEDATNLKFTTSEREEQDRQGRVHSLSLPILLGESGDIQIHKEPTGLFWNLNVPF